MGRCATGISSLSKEFAVSPVYFDFSDKPAGTKEKIDATIGNNFATIEEVEGKSFTLTRYLFASVCFHYEFLDIT